MKKVAIMLAVILGIFVGINSRKAYLVMTTDPPPAFMVRNLEEQVGCAKKAGFVFKPPMLRMIRLPYGWDTPPNEAHMAINVITLTYYSSYETSLYETLAHELGHIIDYQTGRKDYPFFIDKQDWGVEAFADAVRDIILNECRSANNHFAD